MKLFSLFKAKPPKVIYKCSCCGQIYERLPLCFGSDYPDHYFSVPPEEREQRIELKESLCVVDGEHFFHRGRLTIPITDYTENLVFNVWTSLSAANFNIRMRLWNDPNRMSHEPYFGWLQTIVPSYGNTINIKTIAIEQEVGLIPEIRSIEESHALTIDQQNGIKYERATEIVGKILKDLHQQN